MSGATVAPARPPTDGTRPPSPYKGLTPYTEEDVDFFFGREQETEIIRANLLAARLTLLYGESGVGKSSVLHAGAAHRLRREARRNLAETGRPEHAVIVLRAWRDNPVAGLLREAEDAVTDLVRREGVEIDAGAGLAEGLDVWAERLDGDLLVILDQFEEYFLYHGTERGPGSFAYEFPRAVNRLDLRASFLVSIREDALAKLDVFKGSIPALFDNRLRIDHLSRENARAAIEGPVRAYNERVGDAEACTVEPELVDAVLAEIGGAAVNLGQVGAGDTNGAGAASREGRIQAPYLQLVLTRIWDEELSEGSRVLRAATLRRCGGAETIVRTRLDEAMASLSPEERDVAARVFHYLVTRSGAKVAHTVADLASYAELPEPAVTGVVQHMAGGDIRILRPVPPPPGSGGATRYEIFHDVIGPAVLDWRARHTEAAARREAEARARRERRKTRIWAVVALLSLAACAAVAVLSVWAVGQKRTAQTREAEAAAAADRAGSGVVAARAREVSFGPAASALAGAEAYGLSPSLEARGLVLSSLHPNAAVPRVLVGHSHAVRTVAFSPDGRLASAGDDWTLRLWDEQGRPVGEPYVAPSETEVASVAFNADGTLLAAAIGDEVYLFAVKPSSWGFVKSFRTRAHVNAVVFAGADLVALAGEDGHVRIWDVTNPTRPARVADETLGAPVPGLAFNPTKRLLAAAGPEPRLWTVSGSGQLEPGPALPRASGRDAQAVAFSEDGRTLAAGVEATILLWSTSGAAPPTKLVGLSGVLSIAFADNETLVSGGWDDGVTVWDLDRGGVFGPPRVHAGDVHSVAVGPNGTIASGGEDSYVKLWALDGRDTLAATVSASLSDVIYELAAGAGGKVAVANEAGGTVVWQFPLPGPATRSPEPLATLDAPDGSYAVAFHETVLAASDGGSFALWETGRDCPTAPAEPCRLGVASAPDFPWDTLSTLAFSSSGDLLAAADESGRVTLWGTSDPRKLRLLASPATETASAANTAAVSPDGTLLAVAYAEGSVRLWDVRDPERPAALPPLRPQEGQYVEGLAFSPDGELLAVAGGAETAEIFSVQKTTDIRRIEPALAHDTGVWQVAFSPDGRVLATGSALGDVRLWDVATRRPLGSTLPGTLPGRDADVDTDGLAFGADGTLFSAGNHNPVVAWDPALWSDDAETLRASACALARRNLGASEWGFFFQDTRVEDARRATCPEYPVR